MIRFCDKEVFCVKADQLDRGELFCYFLNGHREDMLCVIDDDGKYKGNITYVSLLNSNSLLESIQTAKVIMDESIWIRGRKYFAEYEKLGDELVMLPVVDENNQLLCFAYQDEDANREIRQLRELSECEDALTFHDIFPQYDLVTIWECNELAYYFVKYLQEVGVSVVVKGMFWEKFDNFAFLGGESLDYRNLNIYSEGTWEKSQNLREYLLRSVSVEFECIDIIYERNVKNRIIKQACLCYDEFLEKLNGSECIAIKDIGQESLTAYDWLLGSGLTNICLLTNEENDNGQRFIDEKPLYNLKQICQKYKNAIIIDCQNEHSTLGMDGLDNFDYKGFERNKRYFCLKEYVELPKSDLRHVLNGKNIVLAGDVFLCKRFYEYYKEEMECNNITYYNILNDDKAEWYHGDMPLVTKENINKKDLLIVFAPEYIYSDKKIWDLNKHKKIRTKFAEQLYYEKCHNYLFSSQYIPENQMHSGTKYKADKLKPKGIIVGAMLMGCGNVLLRLMLREYDKIVMMRYGVLNENLILFCVKLAGEKSENILNAFWMLMTDAAGAEGINKEFQGINLFNKKMTEMLQLVSRPTAQELFVIFHVAYEAMYGKDVSDVSDCIIFWETHGLTRIVYPDYIRWLDEESIRGLVVTNSRNNVVRAGGMIRCLKESDYFSRTDTVLLRAALESPEEWNEKESVWGNIEVKFEELKCNPQSVIKKIGDGIGISFDNLLDHTIYNGEIAYQNIEKIIKPVYNPYEEFLSQFDKMHIAILSSEWQKKRGYP